MAVKIDRKIIKHEIARNEEEARRQGGLPAEQGPKIIQMHERLERPEMLLGSTYKIKTPLSEHALYVTVNDIVLNAGTEHEHRRPFEVFINSKNMDHFQWIVALTRIISAVFRKGGDVTFLGEELQAVFDPRGGYFKKGGRFMPSLVAEIGDVIEQHLRFIGMYQDDGPDENQRKFMAEKRAEFEKRSRGVGGGGQAEGAASAGAAKETGKADGDGYPDGAQLCKKCSTRALVCLTTA